MKQENVRTGAESDLTDLDRELAQMAGEVPPMPADFHQKWMSAVREEAAGRQAPPSRERKTTPWLRWLSTAAVFVFLIGGTMIYRASKNSRNAPAAAVEREAPAETAVVAEEAEERSAPEEEAVPAAAGAFSSAADTEAAPPALGMYSSEPAEEAAYEMDMAYEADAGSANEPMLFAAAEKSAPVMASQNSAAPEEAEEAAEAEEAVEAAEAEPPAEPEPAEEPALAQAEENTAPEEAAEPAKDDLGGFLKDMGDFLLAALPYLLGAAALALLLSYLLTRKKRRGGAQE